MVNNESDKKVFRLISTLVLVGLVVILAVQNSSTQIVKIYFWSISLPLFVLLFLVFILGVSLMFILLFPKYRKAGKAQLKLEKLESKITELENKLGASQGGISNEQ